MLVRASSCASRSSCGGTAADALRTLTAFTRLGLDRNTRATTSERAAGRSPKPRAWGSLIYWPREMDPRSNPRGEAVTDATQPPVEVQFITVEIDSKLPGRIADLFAIKSDLEFGRDCAATYVARHFIDGQARESIDQAETIIRALWSSALIAYRRVFTTGSGHRDDAPRFDFRPLLDTLLTTAQQQAHHGFRNVANTHIAHQNSDRQQVKFLAWLYPPPFPRGLNGVGPLLIHSNAPPLDEAETFIEICNILIAYAHKEVDTFLGDYLAAVGEQGQPAVDHLYALAVTQGEMTIRELRALRDNSESDEQRCRFEALIQGQEQMLTSLKATESKGITAPLDIDEPPEDHET
jgi:hypothetical protein